ncbi:MAG TPA: UbiH/UbiF/VisC/COQ6 family ubiquinone biosynthesis hydroxylase [Motiliproteus sp.]
MNRFQTEVAILGGGMVGAALAALLDQQGISVTLIEQQLPEPFSPDQPHDLRVSALSPASQRILASVDSWDGVLRRRVCPYQRMRVWEQRGFGDASFNAADSGEAVLGHIVENRVVQLALWEHLSTHSEVSLCAPAALQQLRYHPDGSLLTLDNGDQIHCQLLIGADGARSAVREAAGIGVQAWDYPQHALIAYVATEAAQQDITWQRFVPAGPQALLPLSGQYASLVWYEAPDEVARLQRLDDDSFLDQLSNRFPAELGGITALLGRASFPLKRQHALRYVAQGVALVGDAAHTIHPLAGQGVNIGLLDAAVLSEELGQAHQAGGSLADLQVLRRYEQRRRQHNLLVMNAMELLQRGFGNQQPLLRWARNLGLALAERSGPLKQRAMRMAMGLDGDLPLAAR